jgi:multidrug resistance efflux pump
MRIALVRGGQVLRVGFGLGLVVVAAYVYGPSLVGTVSTEAVVNARAIAVVSPIEGVAVTPPPPVGTRLRAGEPIAEIRNGAVDRTYLTQLQTEADTLAGRIAALAGLQQDLAAQRARLEAERQRVLAAAVDRLTIMVQEYEAAARAADAAAAQADREWRRKEALLASESVSQPAVDMAADAARRARAEAERAHHAAERTRQDLSAARGGVLAGDRAGDGYPQQRMDELAIREAETAAQLSEARARKAELERVLPAEIARLRERAEARLVAPVDGVLWRSMAVGGGWVAADRPLATLIDCSERVVQAKFPGRNFESVHPGMAATVRILGAAGRERAVVRDLRAMGASEASDRFAAPVPVVAKDEFLVTLVLAPEPPSPGATSGFCDVGRAAEVSLGREPGRLAQGIDAVGRWLGRASAGLAAARDAIAAR